MFKHPSTCIVVGPSQSGKTTLVRKLIRENVYNFPIKKIKWHYSVFQPWFLKEKNICFEEGLPKRIDADLIVIDDLKLSDEVSQLFMVNSHHCKVSVILILQNLFPRNKVMRDITLNTHYLILFKNNRDESQINCLGRQAFSGKLNFFIDAYKKATYKPYGYLCLDFHPTTNEKYRVRDSCFPDDKGIYRIYIPKK